VRECSQAIPQLSTSWGADGEGTGAVFTGPVEVGSGEPLPKVELDDPQELLRSLPRASLVERRLPPNPRAILSLLHGESMSHGA
jgi:hypothetical protein